MNNTPNLERRLFTIFDLDSHCFSKEIVAYSKEHLTKVLDAYDSYFGFKDNFPNHSSLAEDAFEGKTVFFKNFLLIPSMDISVYEYSSFGNLGTWELSKPSISSLGDWLEQTALDKAEQNAGITVGHIVEVLPEDEFVSQ